MPTKTISKRVRIKAGTGPVPRVRRFYDWSVLQKRGDNFEVTYGRGGSGRAFERSIRSQASKLKDRKGMLISVARLFDASGQKIVGCRVTLTGFQS